MVDDRFPGVKGFLEDFFTLLDPFGIYGLFRARVTFKKHQKYATME